MATEANRVYDSQRALLELEEARAKGEAPTGTGIYPKLQMPETEDTVPMLPALLRPQAE